MSLRASVLVAFGVLLTIGMCAEEAAGHDGD